MVRPTTQPRRRVRLFCGFGCPGGPAYYDRKGQWRHLVDGQPCAVTKWTTAHPWNSGPHWGRSLLFRRHVPVEEVGQAAHAHRDAVGDGLPGDALVCRDLPLPPAEAEVHQQRPPDAKVHVLVPSPGRADVGQVGVQHRGVGAHAEAAPRDSPGLAGRGPQ